MNVLKPKRRLRLKSEFELAGLRTNREIANALGFSKSAIDSILGGWHFPGPEVQVAMVKLLGISLERLQRLL
jgi:hypothetical protein